MVLCKKIALLMFIICFFNRCYADNVSSTKIIKMVPKQSIYDISYDTEIKILELALSETNIEFGKAKIKTIGFHIGREYLLQLLNLDSSIDIATTEPTRMSEINYNSVKVPLFKGLMSYRMILIPQNKQKLFKNIKTPEQLKSLRACQVDYWIDSDILEYNGYKVVRVKGFTDMYDDLNAGKCDYASRSIINGNAEAKLYNSKHLSHPISMFTKFLFHYHSPKVAYTSHKNFELTGRLYLGLKRANNDGKLLKLLKSDPVTRFAFPLRKWKKFQIIKLNNPNSMKLVPIFDKSLWLHIPQK